MRSPRFWRRLFSTPSSSCCSSLWRFGVCRTSRPMRLRSFGEIFCISVSAASLPRSPEFGRSTACLYFSTWHKNMKQLRPAILLTLFFTVFTGLVFTYTLYAVDRLMPHQADGSLIKNANGGVIGSELIAQPFSKPEYFHPRPSATGDLGYGTFDKDHPYAGSVGTNLGPTSDKLINGIHKKTPDGKDDPSNFDGVKDLAVAYRKENNLPADAMVPADAVTRSASGIDQIGRA